MSNFGDTLYVNNIHISNSQPNPNSILTVGRTLYVEDGTEDIQIGTGSNAFVISGLGPDNLGVSVKGLSTDGQSNLYFDGHLIGGTANSVWQKTTGSSDILYNNGKVGINNPTLPLVYTFQLGSGSIVGFDDKIKITPSTGVKPTAIGYAAGNSGQDDYAIAIGNSAGATSQGENSIALGVLAGATSQGQNSIALGSSAGQTGQGNHAIALGSSAGQTGQGIDAIALGRGAGDINQGVSSIALGQGAGQTGQGNGSIALGQGAGLNNQGVNSIALGHAAGQTGQKERSIAIGFDAGHNGQGLDAIALGHAAGQTGQGNHAIAIGNEAGYTNQHDNSIIINASGNSLNNTTQSGLFIKPIRGVAHGLGSNVLVYDHLTGEITYSTN